MRNLFFTPELSLPLNWEGRTDLRAASVRPHNKEQIASGLKNMSPESIRNRFLGSKRAFSEKELEYLTHLDGWNHYAFGIEEVTGEKRGIAIVRLVRSSHDEREAEVAITVIDEFQHRGLGTILVQVIFLAARERGVERLSFTFLPQNEDILRLISKVGRPIRGYHQQDYVQFFLDIKDGGVEEIKSRLEKILPGIGRYHLRT